MSGDFFDRLDAELSGLTQRGAHLSVAAQAHRRWRQLARRGVLSALLVLALALSLASEFPASAAGHVWSAQVSRGARL